jgi:hypothetical protein
MLRIRKFWFLHYLVTLSIKGYGIKLFCRQLLRRPGPSIGQKAKNQQVSRLFLRNNPQIRTSAALAEKQRRVTSARWMGSSPEAIAPRMRY